MHPGLNAYPTSPGTRSPIFLLIGPPRAAPSAGQVPQRQYTISDTMTCRRVSIFIPSRRWLLLATYLTTPHQLHQAAPAVSPESRAHLVPVNPTGTGGASAHRSHAPPALAPTSHPRRVGAPVRKSTAAVFVRACGTICSSYVSSSYRAAHAQSFSILSRLIPAMREARTDVIPRFGQRRSILVPPRRFRVPVITIASFVLPHTCGRQHLR